jgi:probable phosphoglycerate mutase
MNLYLVRHGMTQSNIDKLYNGIIDEPLIAAGKKDLECKKERYNGMGFDYIYSSPLQRCLQSFQILFSNHNIDELRDDLVEMDFGDWLGIKYEEKFKELFALGYTFDDLIDPENGETYESLFKRTNDFIDEIKIKHENDTVLVMCHGLVIASIIYNSFPINKNMYELSPDNGLGYLVEINGDDYSVSNL